MKERLGEIPKRRHIRLIIYVICGLFVLFLIFGRKDTGKDNLPENIQKSIPVESSVDKEILSKAQTSGNIKKQQPSATDSLESTSGISIVKNPDIKSVAEPPKSQAELLQELQGLSLQMGTREPREEDKKKSQPIYISREVLHNKKINFIPENRKPLLDKKNIPVLGEDSDKQLPLITAPVDYKIFRDQWTWNGFISSQKGKFDKTCRRVDFSKENIVILVSMSEFPSGIFKVVEVMDSEDETIIHYKIDPLAMSAENITREYDHYSCAVIRKNNLPVRLEQVP